MLLAPSLMGGRGRNPPGAPLRKGARVNLGVGNGEPRTARGQVTIEALSNCDAFFLMTCNDKSNKHAGLIVDYILEQTSQTNCGF